MDKLLIPIGIAYAQVLEDLRAVMRHELNNLPAAPTGATTLPVDELLSIREAAKMLDVTVQTVHDWKRRGLLRYHKLGSRSYIKKADVLSALSGHQRSTKTGKGGSRG